MEWPWTREGMILGEGPGKDSWGGPLTTDDTRVPRQSRGQVDMGPSPAGQALEQDGWPVLPECAMDKPQGQGLWGLQGHQLQLRYLGWRGEWTAVRPPSRAGVPPGSPTGPLSAHLQGVTLIGPDEKAGPGLPWLQGKPLLPVGVHHALHVFSREAVELGQLQEGTQGHEAICGQAGCSGAELVLAWARGKSGSHRQPEQSLGAWRGSQGFTCKSLPFLSLHFLNLHGTRICLGEGHKDKVSLF